MQLSAKALLKPFNNLLKDDDTPECGNNDEDAGVEPIDEGSDDDEEDGEGGDDPTDDDDDDDDPFEKLGEADREQLLENTAAVRATLNKVCIVTLCSNR
jgi:hypothetical protein